MSNPPNRSERTTPQRTAMGTGRRHHHRRLNTVIAGWICIAIGAGISLAESSPFSLSLAAPLSIGGIILLLVGLSRGDDQTMDSQAISSWAPEQIAMPDAGRPMFRVDTTLEEPIRTSVLCGRCTNLEWVEGPKPKGYSCPECLATLWEPEEE